MSVRVFIVSVLLMAVLVGGYTGLALAGQAKQPVTSSKSYKDTPEAVQEYWTEERMRNARPVDNTIVVPPSGGPEICPMDAMICPDGSAVSRTSPDCQFAPCPGSGVSGSAPTKGPMPPQAVGGGSPGVSQGSTGEE